MRATLCFSALSGKNIGSFLEGFSEAFWSSRKLPFTLLNTDRLVDRLQELGYARDAEFDFEWPAIDAVPGVLSTVCDKAHEIEYKTERQKAWRNLVICAINAGLSRKLFSLRANDNRFGAEQMFDFALRDGTAARGWVSDAGFGELNIHAAVNPKGDLVRAYNAGFSAGDAFATTWIERKKGAWMQKSVHSFRCRKPLMKRLASLDVEPEGYGDRGRVIM